MLKNLYIKNFVLIDELNIDFDNDFSVFTGETGAGKSIFIDCISCLSGGKLLTSMIRNGCDKAIIEGAFEVSDSIKEKLEDAGYSSEECVITREINTDGKSVTRINSRITTVSFIKNLIGEEVDIHCQHDNQYLLNDKYHLSLLDEYLNDNDLLRKVSEAYKVYNNLQKEYDNLANTTYSESQLEIIKFQLNEISKLKIKDLDEDEKIQEKLKIINDLEKNQANIDALKDLFENDGILDKLYEFTKLANKFSSFEAISQNLENITSSYYNISDDYETIVDVLKSNTVDLSEVDELNSRLYTLQRAKRKYATTLSGLVELQNDLQSQLDSFANKEIVLSKLEKQMNKALNDYMELATKLSNNRKKASEKLAGEIMNQLKDLSLAKAVFKASFKETKPTSKGIDEVVFMVSMNAGTAVGPLNKIASGGELSRLMLGLKVIFARLQKTGLIIFDEIDTGVSGKVATNIGLKMANLGKSMQVFAVTHLPSVAACGNSHYLIEKVSSDTTTNSKVTKLTNEERISQIALLSSAAITDNSLLAAKELLEKSQASIEELC